MINKKIIAILIVVLMLVGAAAAYVNNLYIWEQEETIMDTTEAPYRTNWVGFEVITFGQEVEIPSDVTKITEFRIRGVNFETTGRRTVRLGISECDVIDVDNPPKIYESDWMPNDDGIKYKTIELNYDAGQYVWVNYQDTNAPYTLDPNKEYAIMLRFMYQNSDYGDAEVEFGTGEDQYSGGWFWRSYPGDTWKREHDDDMKVEVIGLKDVEIDDPVAKLNVLPSNEMELGSTTYYNFYDSTVAVGSELYRLDYENDGTWDFPVSGYTPSTMWSYEYTSTGTYTAKLEVIDGNGVTDTDTETITITEPIEDHPPTAYYSVDKTTVTVDESVQFTDESEDPDGTIEDRAWDFDDGSVISLTNPVHSWDTKGDYTVNLVVTDNDGLTDSTDDSGVSKTITVIEQPIDKCHLTCFAQNLEGTPIQYVTVKLESETGTYEKISGTGSDNSVTFQSLECDDSYKATFSKNGEEDVITGISNPTGQKFDDVYGELDLGNDPPGTDMLTVVVTNKTNDEPIKGAEIELYNSDGVLQRSGITLDDGVKVFDELYPGDYTVDVKHEDYNDVEGIEKEVVADYNNILPVELTTEDESSLDGLVLSLVPLLVSIIIAIIGIVIGGLIPKTVPIKLVVIFVFIIVAIFVYVLLGTDILSQLASVPDVVAGV